MFTETARVDGRRLGRRAPSNKPALRLDSILKAVPAHPILADYVSGIPDFGMYANDRYGDCGPVAVANSLKVMTLVGGGSEYSVSQDDVFDLYRRSGNPNFDPATDADDNGVDMQTMLDALLKGGIGGRKPVAFAKVNVSNVDEVRAAIAIFGGVLWGVNLDVAQQAQTEAGGPWDYALSGEWGGHAVFAGRYTSETGKGQPDFSVVSWARTIGVTDAFCRVQLEEAWVVVWPEHLTHPAFLAGVDLGALAAAYKALTGRDLPVPAPPAPSPSPSPSPSPAPAPSPVPVPGAAPFPGASVAVASRITRAADRAHLTETAWMERHFDRYFDIVGADFAMADVAMPDPSAQ